MHCKMSVAGHLQSQSVADKPGQSGDRPKDLPDISMLSPELQQQWHVDGNSHLGAIKVTPRSIVKAVWQCNMCPAGQPHIWTRSVAHRTRLGAKCPYCANKLVCLHNVLATKAPVVACYWNHSKNEKTPEQTVAGSRLRAEWQCPVCKFEWKQPSPIAPAPGLVVPSAVEPSESPSLTESRPLLKLSLLSWLSGTRNEMMSTASTQIKLLLAAASWCTGSAHAVQKGSHISGQQDQKIA